MTATAEQWLETSAGDLAEVSVTLAAVAATVELAANAMQGGDSRFLEERSAKLLTTASQALHGAVMIHRVAERLRVLSRAEVVR